MKAPGIKKKSIPSDPFFEKTVPHQRTARAAAGSAGSFVISCHADTGFRLHRLRRSGRDRMTGILDNFAGVHAVMRAYFSGRLNPDCVRIELTHGEETDMAGAKQVLETLSARDMVVVVDVTGAPTRADITIEKCGDARLRAFVETALRGMAVDVHAGCPDPVADADETDVYRTKLRDVFFLGIPCTGGDYNAGEVTCRERSLAAAGRALIRLAAAFSKMPSASSTQNQKNGRRGHGR
jgi:hypothetical protein